MKRLTWYEYSEDSAGLHHDQVAPLLPAHFDKGLSYANHTSQCTKNLVMLVPEFVHVLMTLITYLNSSFYLTGLE